MAFEVVLPRLGWSMESGRLVEWLKQDGDRVQTGEMIFSVEGDKAIQEVEALESGVLRIVPDAPGPDIEVPVGTLLAYICQPGEEPPINKQNLAIPARPVPVETSERQSQTQGVKLAADIRIARPTGASQIKISPRARRVARELGIDWAAVRGSGISGRIREQDIRTAAQIAAAIQPAAIEILDEDIVTPRSANLQTAAPLSLFSRADATRLYELRRGWKRDPTLTGQVIPGYTDMLVRLVSQALAEFPLMNAILAGGQIVLQNSINVGIVFDAGVAQLEPVLKDVQDKGVRQIARERAALCEKARAGQLTLDQITGSTFAIVNLGLFDVDGFTPVIAPGGCAALGLGRIAPRVVVIDADHELTAICRMLTLSLTFDHRVVDGAPAARFLKRIKEMVENPLYWLLS